MNKEYIDEERKANKRGKNEKEKERKSYLKEGKTIFK